jgi:hypothetical protein
LAAAKKIVNAFQHKNSPSVPTGAKKKIKNSGNPELLIICEDVPQNHDAPAPTDHEGVLPASIPSPETGINSSKNLAY